MSQNHLALDNFLSATKLSDYFVFNCHIYSRMYFFYFKGIINPSAMSKYRNPNSQKQGTTWYAAAQKKVQKPVWQQHCPSDQCHSTGIILLDST
jgi:hypothetical protein